MASVTTTEEYYDVEDDIIKMTPVVQILSGIGLSVLIIIAIGGNLLTVLAYITDKRLRNVYNFYILNLAITDLMLSSVSMPFYAVYTLKEFTWPFGIAFCKIWLVVDFTLCFESILLLLILSADRMLLITFGSLYTTKITMKVAVIQIAISWFISFLVYGPAIIGWDYWVGYSTVEDMDCDVEFAYNFAFTTATAIVEFILPFVFLTLMNTIIYFKIRKRNKVSPPLQSMAIKHISMDQTSGKRLESEALTTETATGSQHQSNAANSTTNKRVSGKLNIQIQEKTIDRRDNKAARLLAILVVAFLVFWGPYTISTIVISFCDECVNTSVYEFFNWCLWMKTAINPFLYAFNSVQYRMNFRKLLRCNRRPVSLETSANRTSNTNA